MNGLAKVSRQVYKDSSGEVYNAMSHNCEKCGSKLTDGFKNPFKDSSESYQPYYAAFSDYVTKINSLESKIKTLEEELAKKNGRVPYEEKVRDVYDNTFITPAPFKLVHYGSPFSAEFDPLHSDLFQSDRKVVDECPPDIEEENPPEIEEEDEPLHSEQFVTPSSPLFKGRKHYKSRKKSEKRNSKEILETDFPLTDSNEEPNIVIEEVSSTSPKHDFITPSSPLFKGRKHYKWAGTKQNEAQVNFQQEINLEGEEHDDSGDGKKHFSGKINQTFQQVKGGKKTEMGEMFANEDGTVFGTRMQTNTKSYSAKNKTLSMSGLVTSTRDDKNDKDSDDFDSQGFYDYLCELEGKSSVPLNDYPYYAHANKELPKIKIFKYESEYAPTIINTPEKHQNPVLSWEVIGKERNVVRAKVVMLDNSATGVKIQEVDDGQPCLSCDKCQGYEPHPWR